MPREAPAVGGIFISYRRGDSEGQARALSLELANYIGDKAVFMDVDSIALGRDFRQSLHDSLESCDAFLALIGPSWLDSKDAAGKRRLDDPTDFVRQEIATALKRGVVVIPALVQGTALPAAASLPEDLAPLLRRQAISISDEDWDNGCERLIRALEKVLGTARRRPGAAMRWMLSLAGVAVAMSVVVVIYQPFKAKPDGSVVAVDRKAAPDYGKAVEKSYGAATDALNDVARKIGAGSANTAVPAAAYFVGRWRAVGRDPNSGPATTVEFSADQKVVWREANRVLSTGTWSCSDEQLVQNSASGTSKSRISNRSADHFVATDTTGHVFDFTRQ